MSTAAIGRRFGLFAVERLLRLTLGFLVGVAVGRYLGPSAFGAINFAMATVAVFTVLVGGGTEGVVVRDFARSPGSAPGIMAAGLAIRSVGGAVLASLCGLYALRFVPADDGVRPLVILQSLTLLLGWSDVIECWFQANERPNGALWARVVAGATASAVKILFILCGAGVAAFIVANLVEAFALAAGLVVALRWRQDRPRHLRLMLPEVRRLLREGWPLALSAVSVMLTLQLDRIVLGSIRGTAELGRYAASGKFVEVVLLLPVLTGVAAQRVIAMEVSEGGPRRAASSQRTLRQVTWAVLAAATVICAGSGLIIRFAFGPAFAAAGRVLAVQIWMTVFATHVSLRTRMLVAEGAQVSVLALSLATLAVQAALLPVLVRAGGATGAALSSLIAWAAAVLVFPLLSGRTRFYTLAFLRTLGVPIRLPADAPPDHSGS